MRVFFGLELDTATTIQVSSWRDRQLAGIGKPVPAANFHVTLAFVGALSDPAIERLCLSVDDWTARATPEGAMLEFNCTGYWPRPGIYWLGAETWPAQLGGLAHKLSRLAGAVGAKHDDRNTFQPHITLYRQCPDAPPAPAQPPLISFTYQHFSLFESRPGKSGVSYHVLQDWELAGAAR
ncbi:MAG: RNA 2',3'-cyclic phosphodiesterase [Halioglobus sp.]